jgi:opacity protein-like surface antigen
MKRIRITVLALTTALACSSSAMADRAGRWEGTVQLVGTSSESAGGPSGSGIDVDSDVGIGFGLSYNFTQNLALGFGMFWVEPDYSAVFDTEEDGLVEIDHKLSLFNGQLNGTWNILDGPFTPYLRGGIGWTHVDSNVADGPPVTGCWWDPWWGYICSNFFSTYSDTRFSWGFGAGLRYEFGREMFVQGGYNRLEIDGNNGVEPSFDNWALELGWMF